METPGPKSLQDRAMAQDKSGGMRKTYHLMRKYLLCITVVSLQDTEAGCTEVRSKSTLQKMKFQRKHMHNSRREKKTKEFQVLEQL